jgi:hypothetical protein
MLCPKDGPNRVEVDIPNDTIAFDSKGVGEVVDLSGEFTEGNGRGKGPAVRVFRFPSQIDTKSVDEQLTQLKGRFAHQGLAVDAEPSSLAFQDIAGVEISVEDYQVRL